MPSNHNFVCFDCCLAIRRSKLQADAPRCSRCGSTCASLGYKIPIPAKNDTKAWRALELQLSSESNNRYLSEQATLVRRAHALEQQISELLNRPHNADRDRTIRELQSELEQLKAQRP